MFLQTQANTYCSARSLQCACKNTVSLWKRRRFQWRTLLIWTQPGLYPTLPGMYSNSSHKFEQQPTKSGYFFMTSVNVLGNQVIEQPVDVPLGGSCRGMRRTVAQRGRPGFGSTIRGLRPGLQYCLQGHLRLRFMSRTHDLYEDGESHIDANFSRDACIACSKQKRE